MTEENAAITNHHLLEEKSLNSVRLNHAPGKLAMSEFWNLELLP